MALDEVSRRALGKAIDDYAFPTYHFDLARNQAVRAKDHDALQAVIVAGLRSTELPALKQALASIVYWGFSGMGGLAGIRTERFITQVSTESLQAAQRLLASQPAPGLRAIGALKLAQFSQMSFVSKIRAFLDPHTSAVLDLKLMKLVKVSRATVLHRVSTSAGGIRLTAANCARYEEWCALLARIRDDHFALRRVVDIERGFFHLAGGTTADIALAGRILEQASRVPASIEAPSSRRGGASRDDQRNSSSR